MLKTSIQTRKKFNGIFSCHTILYVGAEIVNKDLLRDTIATLPWSCVVLSNDNIPADLFQKNGREVIETNYNLNTKKILNTKQLNIVRLNGNNDDSENPFNFINTASSKRKETFKKIVDLLCDGGLTHLVIVGYSGDGNKEISCEDFLTVIGSAPNGTIQFWNCGESALKFFNENEVATKGLQDKNFDVYENDIFEFVKDQINDTEDDFVEVDLTNDCFFCDGKPIEIENGEFDYCNSVATLLTEKVVHKFIPNGRRSCERAFLNFLEKSSDEPQWYGYIPQTQFNIKRDFEAELLNLTNSLLKNGKHNEPIVLQGDTGSSKSITLASVAYQIYNERNNPVVFINNNKSLLFSENRQELEDLDRMLQEIESKTKKKSRILIVWDSSSFIFNGKNPIDRLFDLLSNRGRTFTLLCSSYIKDGEKKHYIEATRNINEKEQVEFWKLIKNYSGLNTDEINDWKRIISNKSNDIFIWFYDIITILRPQLEDGLSHEENYVKYWVEQKLQKNLGNVDDSIKFGSISDKFDSKLLEELGLYDAIIKKDYKSEENALDLDGFNLCIAMFSQYKLHAPYSLCYSILLKKDSSTTVYNTNISRFFNYISKIPWIRYLDDENLGTFYYDFRTVREAEIYLANNDFDGEKQFELIKRIIRILGEGYQNNKLEDPVLSSSLQQLLRISGPNSPYNRKIIHNKVCDNLDAIVKAIDEKLLENGYPDNDFSFRNIKVTFLREFYNDTSHSDNDIKQIENLFSTLDFAKTCLKECSEFQSSSNYFNSFAVEKANITKKLLKLIRESDLQNKELTIKKLPSYLEVKSDLSRVFAYDKTDGYPYNALFSYFCEMFNNSKIEKNNKIQYLAEMANIINDMPPIEDMKNIGSTDMDEISKNKAKIFNLFGDTCAKIDDIKSNTDTSKKQFFDFYNQMLDSCNDAGIICVCTNELGDILKGKTNEISENNRKVCEKIIDYINWPENEHCLNNSLPLLKMLLKLMWLSYNTNSFNGYKDRQYTFINDEHWRKLYTISQRCFDKIKNNIDKYDPDIVLIYCLSCFHSGGQYAELSSAFKLSDNYRFSGNRLRMFHPYLICDSQGNLVKYKGKISNIKGDGSGTIELCENRGAKCNFNRYFTRNTSKYQEGSIVDINIAVGYAGLSAVNAE